MNKFAPEKTDTDIILMLNYQLFNFKKNPRTSLYPKTWSPPVQKVIKSFHLLKACLPWQ